MPAKHQMERRTKNQKSVSDDTESDHASTQLDQILTKLDLNKQAADQQYQSLLIAINKINTQLDALETEHCKFVKSLDYTNKEVADLKAGYEELCSTVSHLNCTIDTEQTKEQAVRNSFDRMENEKNLKALLITNIPESRSEDTTKVVLTLAKHLDAELQASDIESVFRIKNDSNPKPALIMVKFNKASARDSL